ncbi:hypothetical protein DMH18_00390 [Streptomyces sp. WAC 06783]|uniref:ATP-binding protein n=1 Tax=Streptomyces sp. WAC 06783 TaxID=2203211 RepID=UPI000F741A23|nr:ATP-binding protein [Streptomyces sp. WAC 06783]RSO13453.1 hypothetical protein DMH18_00390 [Streptomyces sp. WAC 06783]
MTIAPPPQNWAYTLQLPRSAGAPRIARVILRAALDHHGMEELAEVAELLTSELVTNAYLHTDGPSSVRMRRVREGRVRVSVWDTDPAIPASFGGAGAGPDAEAGRGLLLVRLCAANWGGHPIGAGLFGLDGKALWFELVAGRDAYDVAA